MDEQFPVPPNVPRVPEIDSATETEWDRRDAHGRQTMGQISEDLGVGGPQEQSLTRPPRTSSRRRPPTPSERSRPGYDKRPHREEPAREISPDEVVRNAARAEVSLAIRNAGGIDAYIAQDPGNRDRLIRLGLIEEDPDAIE